MQAANVSDRASLHSAIDPLEKLAFRHQGGKEGFARTVSGPLERIPLMQSAHFISCMNASRC